MATSHMQGKVCLVTGSSSGIGKVAEKHDNPQSGFARKVTEAQKVVFTKTLNTSVWEHTVLAKGDLLEEVNTLKNTTGRNIIAYGGATFAASLIQSGLVDELHLIMNPSALGSGLSPFHERRSPLNLSFLHSTSYTCGIVVLQYMSKQENFSHQKRVGEAVVLLVYQPRKWMRESIRLSVLYFSFSSDPATRSPRYGFSAASLTPNMVQLRRVWEK